jgi:surfeit locus 1 family protein
MLQSDQGAVGTPRGLLWPSLFWLVLLAILVALGTWQVQRLHWKEGLIAQREAAIAGPPIPLPATRAAAQALEFHHVELDGRFENRGELYLHAISHDGEPGFHVVTPFTLSVGRTIFVDRGFVPEDRRDPATRAGGELNGRVTVTGLLRLPAARSSWFLPDNEPAKNLWFSIDLPAMAAADHVSDVMPFYVDADTAPLPGGLPVGGQTYAKLPNDHLQYALTWYGLACIGAIYYVLFIRARLKERRKTTP